MVAVCLGGYDVRSRRFIHAATKAASVVSACAVVVSPMQRRQRMIERARHPLVRPPGSSSAYLTRATTLLSPTLVCCPVRRMKMSSRCSQSRPSYKPSPLVAIVPCTCHFRAFIVSSPMSGHSSRGLIAPACVGTTAAARQDSPRSRKRGARWRHERTHHVLLVGQHQDERVAHQRVVGYLLRSRASNSSAHVSELPIRSSAVPSPLPRRRAAPRTRLELRFGAVDAVAVQAVDNVDERIRVFEVVLPQRPQLFLAAHVPHGEHHVLVLHLLHVEACRVAQRSAHRKGFQGLCGAAKPAAGGRGRAPSAPMVGTVLSTSPMCSLYKMVVLPAASRPSITTCAESEATPR